MIPSSCPPATAGSPYLDRRRGFLRHGLALALAAAAPLSLARAASYPSKPVTIVMNFPPGSGALTLMVRALADLATQRLGQPVVVDSKAGAAGNIGAQFVASAPADGYTLLATVDTTLTVNPAIYGRLPFDAERSFVPIATLGLFTQTLVVNPQVLPVASFDALVAHARDNPVHYASAGNGSPGHVASALLAEMAGLKLEHVPYRGNAPAILGVLAGDVPLAFLQSSGVQPHVDSGKLTALATSGTQRSPQLPGVPTVAEAGYPGFAVEFGWVLAAPAGTPDDVIQRWQQLVNDMLGQPEIRQRLAEWDVHPSGAGSLATTDRLARERQRWAEVTRRAGIRADG